MPNGILDGQVALVTGAGSGIGRGCAIALADVGAKVAVTDINEETCAETHEMIRQKGGVSAPHRLDVADEKSWKTCVDSAKSDFGQISILVNNAALKASVAGDKGLLETSVAVWDAIMAANLRGPMLGARLVLPDMVAAGKGSIVMISSSGALHSTAGFATAYSSAKAGLIGLTRSIAVTYGTQGVRCNAIAPGVIMVGNDANLQESFRKASEGLTQRPGRPADIAAMAVFLSSEQGEFINGQVIVIDGGLTAHMPGLATARDV